MGDMTVDELKDKKLWFLWSAKPGKNGKVTKVPFAANGGATGTDDAHKGTWVSFDDAESARNQFRASGLGLKIPKGFFLLDIYHKDMEEFREAQAEVEQKKEKPMSQKMFKVI